MSAWTCPPGLAGILVSGEDLLAAGDRPIDWAVEGLFEAADLVLLAGQEKVALKTMLGLDLGIARILGANWLGFPVRRAPGCVLYLSTETGRAAIGRRLRALCAGRGIPPEEVVHLFKAVTVPISLLRKSDVDRRFKNVEARAKSMARRLANKRSADEVREAAQDDARVESRSMGENVDALYALYSAPRGTFCLVVIDTLRGCLEGDENSSADASRFTQAARELARSLGAPVVAIHHNAKTGDQSNARSARGSGEITAGPEVIITIDASGENPIANFKCRNVEEPPPVGYRLVSHDGGKKLSIETCAGKEKIGRIDEEVLAIFQEHAENGWTPNNVRDMLTEKRGMKSGSKMNPETVKNAIARLLKRGEISKCTIEQKPGRPPFDGYILGSRGGIVPAVHRKSLKASKVPDFDVEE